MGTTHCSLTAFVCAFECVFVCVSVSVFQFVCGYGWVVFGCVYIYMCVCVLYLAVCVCVCSRVYLCPLKAVDVL